MNEVLLVSSAKGTCKGRCVVWSLVLLLGSDTGSHGVAGADDFLPLLIYTVIHANPPNLASNLEYIQRFRFQSRMISESAYFYTQLVSSACNVCSCCTYARATCNLQPVKCLQLSVSCHVPDILPLIAAVLGQPAILCRLKAERRARPVSSHAIINIVSHINSHLNEQNGTRCP